MMRKVAIQVMALILLCSCVVTVFPFITKVHAAEIHGGNPRQYEQADVHYIKVGAAHYIPLLNLQKTLADGIWKHNGKYTTYNRPDLKLVFDSIKLKWWYEANGKLVPMSFALKTINKQVYIPIEGIQKLKDFTTTFTFVKQEKSSLYNLKYLSPWELLHDQAVEHSKEPELWINRLTGDLYQQQASGQPKWLAATKLRANQSLSLRVYRPNAQSMYLVVVDNSGEPGINNKVYHWLFTNGKLVIEKSSSYSGSYIYNSQYIYDRYSIMNDLNKVQLVASNGQAVREMNLSAFGLQNKGINVRYADVDMMVFSEDHFSEGTTYLYSFVTKVLTKLNKPSERLIYVNKLEDKLFFQKYEISKPNDKPIPWEYVLKPQYITFNTRTLSYVSNASFLKQDGVHVIKGVVYVDLKTFVNQYNSSIMFSVSADGLLTGIRPYYQLAWKVGAKQANVNGKIIPVKNAPHKVNHTVVYPIEDLILLSGGNYKMRTSKEMEYFIYYDYSMLSNEKMTTWVRNSTGEVWMKEGSGSIKFMTKLQEPLIDGVNIEQEQLGEVTTLLKVTDVFGEPHLHSRQFQLLVNQGKVFKQSMFSYSGFSDPRNITRYKENAVMVTNGGMELIKPSGEIILNLNWSDVIDEQNTPLLAPMDGKSYSVKYIDKQICLILDLKDKALLLVDLQTKKATHLYRKLLSDQDIKFIDEYPESEKVMSDYTGDGLTFLKHEGDKIYFKYVKMFTNDAKEVVYTLK